MVNGHPFPSLSGGVAAFWHNSLVNSYFEILEIRTWAKIEDKGALSVSLWSLEKMNENASVIVEIVMIYLIHET
jgi:hypothetical protein